MIVCMLPGCEDPHHAKGYCDKHYTRFRKWGSPTYKIKAANGEHVGCKAPSCQRPHKGRGYCEAHLERLNRTGGLANRYGLIAIGTLFCK